MITNTKFKQTVIGLIPEDWEVMQIEEIGKVIGGGTPSTKNDLFYNGDIAWITPRDLSNHKEVYISKGERNITKEGLKNSSAKLMPKETVLFTSRAPIGYVAIARNEVCTNQGFKSIVCNDNTNNKFIYYWLKQNKNMIESLASGSTFKEVSGSILKSIKISLPCIKEQEKISNILFYLDSKIELLQKQNETLEKIGQAIFKQWFVDFEFPNEEGNPYKSSGGEMVDSELEEIPKGWSVGKYQDIVSISTGKGYKRSEYVENGKYPILGANGVIGQTNEYLFDEPLILTGRVGTLGTVYLYDGKNWVSDNVLISKPNKLENYYYAYFTLLKFDFNSLNRGSTQPLITQTDLKNQIIILPKKNLLEIFHKTSYLLFNKISSNKSEIANLQKTRDLLLPKLMTGKIRVPLEVEE